MTTIRSTCVTDNLSSYFAGKASLEDALQDATETFLTSYNSGTFVCSLCGNIVYPKVTTDEHGIFISDTRNEIRGGLSRVINVYTADGKLLATYEGKIDIDTNNGGYVKFDFNGKRYIYYNCFVETIAEL